MSCFLCKKDCFFRCARCHLLLCNLCFLDLYVTDAFFPHHLVRTSPHTTPKLAHQPLQTPSSLDVTPYPHSVYPPPSSLRHSSPPNPIFSHPPPPRPTPAFSTPRNPHLAPPPQVPRSFFTHSHPSRPRVSVTEFSPPVLPNPVDPAKPVDPVNPIDLVDPVDPVDPVAP